MRKDKKHIFAIMLLVCVVIVFSISSLSLLKSNSTNSQESNAHQEIQMATESTSASVTESCTFNVVCDAPYAIFYNLTDNSILFQKEIHRKIHPASLTKLLTACVALEYVPTDTVLSVGSEMELVPKGSSLCLISQGHKLTLHDLLTGMLLASGNDASYTIAVNVARYVYPQLNLSDNGAVDCFVGLMNDYADKIGMANSNFCNPCGWDNSDQFTTVYDLLVLSETALNITEIKEIMQCYEKYVIFNSGEHITWRNSNKLLNPDSRFYCKDAIGMKTGTTNGAGNCLIGAFVKHNKTYIAIVCDCESDTQRYSSLLNLYNSIVS